MPMTNSQFYDMVQATMLKCIEVMRTKGEEYTEGSDNKLANFEEEALETDMPVLNIIHVFANKHQRAINNFRKTGQVESEALEMRFVDRINYLFLELAECIALGYDPREIWLREALDLQGQNEDVRVVKLPPVEERPDLSGAPEEDGEPCCGHPGSIGCCEVTPPVPLTTEGNVVIPVQKEKSKRRRPPRPRPPQTKPQADEDIPLALPDRRFDPETVAERARAKKQRDE